MVCMLASSEVVREVDAPAAWSALWNGQWRVVDHVAGPPSHTIVCHPAPHRTSAVEAARLLSRDEMVLALRRARGEPMKALAADSGRSTAAVRNLLARVNRKLMLRSEAQLVLLFGGADHDDVIPPPTGLEATIAGYGPDEQLLLRYRWPAWRVPPTLSCAERTVVLDFLAGASRREIARSRGTSQRTVANQMASIFRKLRVGSRVELLAALRSR
jgi:DNA-binding CsgD family transcriptional regulator